MNKKRRTEITDKLKKHVTLASLEPGSNVGLLEKKYKIGRSTINKWRQVHRKQESETKIGIYNGLKKSNSKKSSFVSQII